MRRLRFPALRLVRALCSSPAVGRPYQEVNDGVRGGVLENGRWLASSVRRFSTAGESCILCRIGANGGSLLRNSLSVSRWQLG